MRYDLKNTKIYAIKSIALKSKITTIKQIYIYVYKTHAIKLRYMIENSLL